MNSAEIFILQLMMSIFVYALLAKWVVWPWLNTKSMAIMMSLLVAPHAMRHIGLTFLIPSVTKLEIPEMFALMTAWGDFISAVLAIIVLFAYKKQWASAVALTWGFNIFGTVDLINALRHVEAIPTLSGTWYIPTFIVPMLLVSHAMIFIMLFKKIKSSNKVSKVVVIND